MSEPKVRGRFAPSPTGNLHLGNAVVALIGWLQTRSEGGEFLLRIEDLDRARCRPQYVDGIFRDLEYLGLTWDGSVLFQSRRGDLYRHALDHIQRLGRLYPCFCSRNEIARAVAAPQSPADEGAPYPGACGKLLAGEIDAKIAAGLGCALRFRAGGETRLTDLIRGDYRQNVAEAVGDFVVRTKDGTASYQLAVVVDDALSEITHVVRGGDLLFSTPRQIQLFQALDYKVPKFAHTPLILGVDGKRLAKRNGPFAIGTLREARIEPTKIVGFLAGLVGLSEGRPIALGELKSQFAWNKLARISSTIDEESIRRELKL